MWSVGLAASAAALFVSAPDFAGRRAADFVLVNATGTPIRALSIRRFSGGGWQSLPVAIGPGNRRGVPFKDQDCAFDIKALVGADDVVWSGVNLCETSAVILRRDKSGTAWADYE